MSVPTSRKLYGILRNKDLAGLKNFIADGGDLNIKRSSDGMSPLSIALQDSDRKSVMTILEWFASKDDNGAAISKAVLECTSEKSHNIILSQFIKEGFVDAIEKVIGNNPKILSNNIRYFNGAEAKIAGTVLTQAIVFNQLDVVKLLVKNDVEINIPDQEYHVPVPWHAKTKEMYDFLVESGFDESKFSVPFSRTYFNIHRSLDLLSTFHSRSSIKPNFNIQDVARGTIAIDKANGINDPLYITDKEGTPLLSTMKRSRYTYTIEADEKNTDRTTISMLINTLVELGLEQEGFTRLGIRSPLSYFINLTSDSKEALLASHEATKLIERGFTFDGIKKSDLDEALYAFVRSVEDMTDEIKEKIDTQTIMQMYIDAGANISIENGSMSRSYPDMSNIYIDGIATMDSDVMDFIFENTQTDTLDLLNKSNELMKSALKTQNVDTIEYMISLYRSVGKEPFDADSFDYATSELIFTEGSLNAVLDSIDNTDSFVSPMVSKRELEELSLNEEHRFVPSTKKKDDLVMSSKLIKVLVAGMNGDMPESIAVKVFETLLKSTDLFHADEKFTIASYAASYPDTAPLKAVIEKYGKDCLFVQSKKGYLPIQQAAISGQIENVKLILESAGKDVKAFDDYATGGAACFKSTAWQIIKLLKDAGVDVGMASEKNKNAFHYLCEKATNDFHISDFKKTVDALLDAGTDINLVDDEGNTPVAKMGIDALYYHEFHAYMAEKGADYTKLSEDGTHPWREVIDKVSYLNGTRDKASESDITRFEEFCSQFVDSVSGLGNVDVSIIEGSEGLNLPSVALLNSKPELLKGMGELANDIKVDVITEKYASMVTRICKEVKEGINHNGTIKGTAYQDLLSIEKLINAGYSPDRSQSLLLIKGLCNLSSFPDDSNRNMKDLVETITKSCFDAHPDMVDCFVYENNGRPFFADAIDKTMPEMVAEFLKRGVSPDIVYTLSNRSDRSTTTPLLDVINTLVSYSDRTSADTLKKTIEPASKVMVQLLENGANIERAAKINGTSVQELTGEMHPAAINDYLSWKMKSDKVESQSSTANKTAGRRF